MKKFLSILTLITLVLPLMVLAKKTEPIPTEITVLDTIEKIAKLLFWVLLSVSIVFIVYAGILFVTAAGSTEQVEKARHIILYAAIGIIIAMLAYAIREFLWTHLSRP